MRSIAYNVLGTGLLVCGGLGGMAGLARGCAQIGDYEPLLIARMDCNRGYRSERTCNQVGLLMTKQHQKVAGWSGAGLAGMALAYAGYKIRERGSPR